LAAVAVSCGLFLGAGAVASAQDFSQPPGSPGFRIQQAYVSAFCRQPTSGEYDFWRADPRSASLEQMITAHQAWLKTNDGERANMVREAYNKARRRPQPADLAYWDARVKRDGMPCHKVVHDIQTNAPRT
jgi:hypothetical protein